MASSATLDRLLSPKQCSVLTFELQRGVVGDLSTLPDFSASVAKSGILESTAALLAAARRHQVTVVHCRAAFRSDRAGSFRNVPMVNRLLENPDHVRLGSAAAELVPLLGPEESDLDSVRLHGMSPFTGTSLDPMLRSSGASTVIATGSSLNIGVLGLVIEALNRGFDVVVPTDCVAGHPLEFGEQILKNSLKPISTLVTSSEIVEHWESLSR